MIPADDDVDGKVVAALERVGQALRVLLQQQASASGLSPIQTQLLQRLASQDHPQAHLGELARQFDISAASLSDSLNALERKELIARRPEPADRRRVTLTVTRQGQARAAELAGWDQPVREAVAASSDHDKVAMLGQLYELIAALQRAGVVTVARMCITCRHFRPDAHPGQHSPHHCALLDARLGLETLRIDCPEHEHQPAA